MKNTPVDSILSRRRLGKADCQVLGTASIREIVKLVNQIEKETGMKYIRMEMGVPGLPSLRLAIDAEIDALRKGVASDYPNIEGITDP